MSEQDEILNIIRTTVDTLARRNAPATFSAIVTVAAEQIVTSPNPTAARAVLITGIDGIMNLKEFRGMHPDDVTKEMDRRLYRMLLEREGENKSPL